MPPDDAEARRPHLERLFRELGAAGVGRQRPVPGVGLHGGQRAQPHRAGAPHPRRRLRRAWATPTSPTASVAGRRAGLHDHQGRGLPRRRHAAPRRGHDHRAQLPDAAGRGRCHLPAPTGASDAIGDARRPGARRGAGRPRSGHRRRRRSTWTTCWTTTSSVPGSRFFTLGSDHGLPDGRPAAADRRRAVRVRDRPHVPARRRRTRCSTATASSGSRAEVGGGSTARLRERGFSPVRRRLVGHVVRRPAERRRRPRSTWRLPERGRPHRSRASSTSSTSAGPSATPTGSPPTPRSADADGEPLVRTGELVYDGNSQGGIMGGALTALAPDFQRAVLGVPGMALLDAAQPQRRLGGRVRGRLRGRLPRPDRPAARLRPDADAVGPGRGGRLRAAHDDRPAARHADARGDAPGGVRATTRWPTWPPRSRAARSAPRS